MPIINVADNMKAAGMQAPLEVNIELIQRLQERKRGAPRAMCRSRRYRFPFAIRRSRYPSVRGAVSAMRSLPDGSLQQFHFRVYNDVGIPSESIKLLPKSSQDSRSSSIGMEVTSKQRRWRIELMGQLRVSSVGLEIARFRTHKTGALLGYLAYHLDRPHSRECLVELLWPEEEFRSANHRLSVAVSSLRNQFAVSEPNGNALIPVDRTSVYLNSAVVSTDVQQLESIATLLADSADDRAMEQALRQAVDLYRPPLLPGYYEDWIVPEQRRLESLYFSALGRLGKILCARGEHESAICYLLQGVRHDPLREDTHRQLMQCYVAAGQPGLALRQNDGFEERFRAEFGVPPSLGTRKLMDEVKRQLSHSPNSTAIAPSAPLIEMETQPEVAHLSWGAVPIDSPYYVKRPQDGELREAVTAGASIVLLQGPRQVGKSSLLARALEEARRQSARVVFSDLQLINADQLRTVDTFLRSLARSLAEPLSQSELLDGSWNEADGASTNFRRFMRRVIQSDTSHRLVWALDEVDRLFNCAYANEVFACFRAWHNERAMEPNGLWHHLTVLVSYATEPHLVITDENQSPFNVGVRLELPDFSHCEIRQLNSRLGQPLRTDSDVSRFFALLGGHPFLVRRGLEAMVRYSLTLTDLGELVDRDDWIYGDHLRRLLANVTRDPTVTDAVRTLLTQTSLPSDSLFYRLRSAGIIAGELPHNCRLRCGLYERYLKVRLA